jgi:hypothetical protein
MNNPYDVHSWSKQYREEALRQARVQHLAERARASRAPREWGQLGLAWRNPLAFLRGAWFAE